MAFSLKWLLRFEKGYHTLPLEETTNDDSKRGGRDRSPATWQRPRVIQISVLFLLLALITITTLHIQLLKRTAPPPRKHCGDSLQEANTLGCTFDNLVKAWLPPQCPRFGQVEFSQAGMEANNGSAWRYYLDRAGTQELTVDEMAALAHKMEGGPRWWTTGREHMTHCTWMLIRIAYVLSTGDRKDLLVADFHHAKHCAMFMLDRALEGESIDEIRVQGNTVFGSC